MHIGRRSLLLLGAALFAACGRGPTREETLVALRESRPGVEGAVVNGRVWQDGPPWFSCAEVVAKTASGVDSEVVREQVGNWKDLLAAGWITLRDTSGGIVADPGWCVARVTPAGAPNVARWTSSPGPLFPTDQPRRGWTMPVGRRVIRLDGTPRTTSKDAATAEYVLGIDANPDGQAIGATRDTVRFVAELHHVDGKWRVAATRRVVARD